MLTQKVFPIKVGPFKFRAYNRVLGVGIGYQWGDVYNQSGLLWLLSFMIYIFKMLFMVFIWYTLYSEFQKGQFHTDFIEIMIGGVILMGSTYLLIRFICEFIGLTQLMIKRRRF